LFELGEPEEELGPGEPWEVSLDDVDHASNLRLRVVGPKPEKP